MSRFSAFIEHSSNSDDSEAEADTGTLSSDKALLNAREAVEIPRQHGGSFAQRSDPITGVDWSNAMDPVQTGFSDEDIEACVRVVAGLGKNLNLFKLPQLKPLRAALHPLVLEQMKNYDIRAGGQGKPRRKRKLGEGPIDVDLKKEQKRKLAALEEEYINQTQLRALRLKQLESLNSEGYAPRVPDGVAICDAPSESAPKSLPLLTADGEGHVKSFSDVPHEPPAFINPISCYICHKPYIQLHFFYHQLCPDCAAFNYEKRNETANLTGKVCIVTGARCKIGFRSALKLLRCGASVIATTRFPADAAKRYAAETDSATWMNRLHIYGLDFRDISLLEKFCLFVIQNYNRLDAIVNNACQTVRRPPSYYAHLMDAEREYQQRIENGESVKVSDTFLKKQRMFTTNFSTPQNAITSGSEDTYTGQLPIASDVVLTETHCNGSSEAPMAVISSSEMTQIPMAPGDEIADPSAFPTGVLDVNRQQVDLRKKNSWTMKLHEVSTPELAEVFAINAMAPTILNARLKPLMEKNLTDLKFIVNVSAMEGKFYRFKSENHPHTNMAKAALNMMTRTSAQDYVKSNIYMTAVDTGWINDEKPIELAVAHEKKHKFQTPLDEIDAAARVLDPIIGPLKALENGEVVEPPWGLFLKDFMKCEW